MQITDSQVIWVGSLHGLDVPSENMSLSMWKFVFRHTQAVKAQISQCIHTVLSRPSLSAYRIIGNCRNEDIANSWSDYISLLADLDLYCLYLPWRHLLAWHSQHDYKKLSWVPRWDRGVQIGTEAYQICKKKLSIILTLNILTVTPLQTVQTLIKLLFNKQCSPRSDAALFATHPAAFRHITR